MSGRRDQPSERWDVTLVDEADRHSAKLAYDRAILAAKLRGIEHKALVDQVITESEDERELLDRLADPPLNLRGVEAEAVLSMPVRDRSSRYAAKLRTELSEL